MLGPVLSAEDLATRKETDQVLSCSHGASTAGDSKQVIAHIMVMAPMHFPYSFSVGVQLALFRAVVCLFRLTSMLQALVFLVLCPTVSDTLPHAPLQSLEHPSAHLQLNMPYQDVILPPSGNMT